MSATASHFSMELALEATSVWVIIWDATRLLICEARYREMRDVSNNLSAFSDVPNYVTDISGQKNTPPI